MNDSAAANTPRALRPRLLRLKTAGTPLILVAVTIAFALLPALKLPAFFESFLYLMFFWIALATSWTILSGFTGYVSFGHGAFFGAGVYAVAVASQRLPFWAALAIAGLLALSLGVVVGVIVFRVKRLRGELFALLTLALAFVLSTIVLNTPIDGGPGVMLSGVALPRIYESPASAIYLLGMAVGMGSLAAAWAVQHSRLGRGLFAISDDEDVAEVQGVPTFSYKIAAFAISSGLAGLAGGVHAVFLSYVTVNETFSITVPLYVLLMSVLGGARHWLGPAIGAIFVTILSYSFTSGDWALAARGGIGLTLVLTTLFFSDGVMGLIQARIHARKRKRFAAAAAVAAPMPAAASAPHTGGVLLRCENVQLSFIGTRALDGVDLEVHEGEILGLVGPNGSGKSTLINVISGFYKPNAGHVWFGATDTKIDLAAMPGHLVARQGIARTYQIPRPFARQTVIENVALSAMFGAADRPYADALGDARHWLSFVGLADRAQALPAELNLHQRKFLELARALAARPKLIMLDEVLAGLTPTEITSAVAMVRRIRDQGATVIFVEHNMRAVLELTDRLVVLNQGKLIAQGPPRAVIAEPQVVAAYLGTDDAPAREVAAPC